MIMTKKIYAYIFLVIIIYVLHMKKMVKVKNPAGFFENPAGFF